MIGDFPRIDFSRLLQESRQLNSRIRAGCYDNVFLPRIQRPLEQVEELSAHLAAKVSGYADRASSKTAMFLASKGVDLDFWDAELKKVGTMLPRTSKDEVSYGVGFGNLDADEYLQAEIDLSIIKMINRMEKESQKVTDEFFEISRHDYWTKLRENMYQKVPIFASKTIGIKGGKERFGPKNFAYAAVIKSFNEARLKGMPFDLFRAFENELRSIDGTDLKMEMLLDCWKVLEYILGDENTENVFEIKNLRNSYLANIDSSLSRPWRTQLAKGSKSFLEELFIKYVDRTLAQYPRDALLGGRPSKLERVRAFCDIKIKRMTPPELSRIELVNGVAVWLIIYHLVRCGFLQDALSFAQSHEIYFLRSDVSFMSYLKAYVSSSNGVLSPSLQNQLRLEYSNLISLTSFDPFKLAILKIIGKCDLGRKSVSGVIQTSEDYIWLQYQLISDTSDEGSLGNYVLSDLQKLVCEYGPNHFDPKQTNPWHYFEILCLVGLFEKGIEYLYTTGNGVDAVYFATAFVQAETFRFSKPKDSLFVRTGTTLSINFASLVNSYSKVQEDVIDSINTIILLTIPGTKKMTEISAEYNQFAIDCIRDVVLSRGDLGALLGDIRPDGTYRTGLLAQYSRLLDLQGNNLGFIDKITVAAAEKCNAIGQFKEALQLFNLARKYDEVLEILSYRMSRTFVSPYSALESDELKRTAEAILQYYLTQNQVAIGLDAIKRSTCSTLIVLLQLRRTFEESNWTLALDSLLSLDSLLPLQGDISSISQAADRTRDLPDSLSMLLPELMLMTMTIIIRRVEELAGFIGIDAGRAQQTELLKRMARNLMTFAGMLRMRVPAEIYAQLTRMETSLN